MPSGKLFIDIWDAFAQKQNRNNNNQQMNMKEIDKRSINYHYFKPRTKGKTFTLNLLNNLIINI